MALAAAEDRRRRAEQLAGRFPPLMVAAERVAASIVQGAHGRRRTGPGEAFWQFRRYAQGDPLNRIDWRQSARSDHVFVRENEWEAAQSVWLWRDTSPSMDFTSGRDLPPKRERAELLLLAAAALLLRGGERVGLLGHGRPPGNARATLMRLSSELPGLAGDGIPAGMPLPRHARIVLIGDFLVPLDEVKRRLADYAGAGVRGHLLQVLDPAELTLPYKGRIRFEGVEEDGVMLAPRAESIRRDYLDRLEAHCAALADLAGAAGWSSSRHATDQSAANGLLALHAAIGC